jgi:hypothetical protein
VSGKALVQYGMRAAKWLCALAACHWLVAPPVEAQGDHAILIHRTGRFGAAGITESSGVVVSRRHAGVLWTHNDSGDGPWLYAVDSTGRRLAAFRVRDAAVVDWEDLALGPCPRTGQRDADCLYVGDIGDNAGRRPFVTLYVVREPDPATTGHSGETGPARALQIRYADGPHDAEALVVDPDGSVGIITKGRGGPILRYTIPAGVFRRESVTVQAVDTLAITAPLAFGRWVTGAAIAPSGTLAVVRTYTDLHLYAVHGGRWTPEPGRCHLGLAEPQGEGVDFVDERTRTFVLTSERGIAAEGVITTVRCPPP